MRASFASVWILLKSYLVLANVKSRSECPKSILFEEFVELLPERPVHTGALVSSAITIIKVASCLQVWILLSSYPVPANVKSRSECPKTPLFVEYVELLPGTANKIVKSRFQCPKMPLFVENVTILPGTDNTRVDGQNMMKQNLGHSV